LSWRQTASCAAREGGDHLETHFTGAESVEQFGSELAEAQALPDMPFGRAEALNDRIDRSAGINQRRHGGEFVGGMHPGADGVFGERGLNRFFRLLDLARNRMIGMDDAL
jgi:hypothetical protein